MNKEIKNITWRPKKEIHDKVYEIKDYYGVKSISDLLSFMVTEKHREIKRENQTINE